LTSVATQYERFFDVLVKNVENTQKGGKKGHFKPFSEPWLAWATKLLKGEVTSSPGRARLLQVKATTCLGELP